MYTENMSEFLNGKLNHLIEKIERGELMVGYSVTGRVKSVKQPWGGYIRPKQFSVTTIGEGQEGLSPYESVHASLMGMAVDYLTRFMLGAKAEDAFTISMKGALIIRGSRKAEKLLAKIRGLDDESITCAIKLAGYDVCYRSSPLAYKSVDWILVDKSTIGNVRIMVERSLKFVEEYGPIILEGFTFEGGYTDIVQAGDGDFITEDTLWDFKVTSASITTRHTLQLLMYWRMGLRSVHPEFEKIEYLGIYNPRLNRVYRLFVKDVPEEVIHTVERDIIGYAD